jgi:hypothetical protein
MISGSFSRSPGGFVLDVLLTALLIYHKVIRWI